MNRLHRTALLEAVIIGDGGEKHQKIVRLLVEHGVALNIGDEHGITALEHAEDRGFCEVEDLSKNAE